LTPSWSRTAAVHPGALVGKSHEATSAVVPAGGAGEPSSGHDGIGVVVVPAGGADVRSDPGETSGVAGEIVAGVGCCSGPSQAARPGASRRRLRTAGIVAAVGRGRRGERVVRSIVDRKVSSRVGPAPPA